MANNRLTTVAAWAAMALLALHLPFLSASCSSIDCPVQNTVAVYYDLSTYDSDGNVVPDTLTDTLWIWTRRPNGTDTLILNRLSETARFKLEISYQQPEDLLVFAIRGKEHPLTVDTVWLAKDDIPHFESVDCSAHFFHELTAVRSTHEAIDSIVINNPSVNYATDVTHLNVFFKH